MTLNFSPKRSSDNFSEGMCYTSHSFEKMTYISKPGGQLFVLRIEKLSRTEEVIKPTALEHTMGAIGEQNKEKIFVILIG